METRHGTEEVKHYRREHLGYTTPVRHSQGHHHSLEGRAAEGRSTQHHQVENIGQDAEADDDWRHHTVGDVAHVLNLRTQIFLHHAIHHAFRAHAHHLHASWYTTFTFVSAHVCHVLRERGRKIVKNSTRFR
ncbi:hypothetical protein E2C01_046388 [Portunus trituberculatus]|uniref:Uncharacterized protein n=1 Tax=Portunus trituberculatus TaxID=210409 RepID=A0A5B7G4N0_PORTR|nr:hypothetical protein [Portunus trituberculatus]